MGRWGEGEMGRWGDREMGRIRGEKNRKKKIYYDQIYYEKKHCIFMRPYTGACNI